MTNAQLIAAIEATIASYENLKRVIDAYKADVVELKKKK